MIDSFTRSFKINKNKQINKQKHQDDNIYQTEKGSNSIPKHVYSMVLKLSFILHSFIAKECSE